MMAEKASPACKVAQPVQLMVGMAMVARGEFAYLVAETAADADYNGGPDKFMKPEVYAAVIWALVSATIVAPITFKWALAVFKRATPMVRSETIGGDALKGQGFCIRINAKFHPGVQREILQIVNQEGCYVMAMTSMGKRHPMQARGRAPSAERRQRSRRGCHTPTVTSRQLRRRPHRL